MADRNVDMVARTIPFTQYLRPDGRKQDVLTSDPSYTDEDLKAAQAIIDAGFRFEIEVLTNGMISMTISDSDGDYVNKLCSNTISVPDTVKRLIHTYDIETLKSLRDQQYEIDNEEGEDDEPAF